MSSELNDSDQAPKPGPHPASNPAVPPPYWFQPFPAQAGEDLNLIDLWNRLWERRWVVVGVMALSVLLAISAAFLMTPVYRVEALLAPVSDEPAGGLSALASQFGGLASMAGIDLSGSGNETAEAMATLKSRAFTTEFMRNNNLLPIIFSKQWDTETEEWKVTDPDDIPTYWDAFEKFDRKIRFVSQDVQSGLVTLAIEWEDPELAAIWASELIERINASMRERAIQEAKRSLDYLNKELTATSSVEVKQAIYGLIENQAKTMMLANVRDEYAFRVIDPPGVPDRDDFESPKRGMLIVLGVFVGGMLGVALAMILSVLSGRKVEKPHLDESGI